MCYIVFSTFPNLCVILAERLNSIFTEMLCLENRLQSRATVFRIVDWPDRLLFSEASASVDEVNDNCSTVLELSRYVASNRAANGDTNVSKSKKGTVDEPDFTQVNLLLFICVEMLLLPYYQPGIICCFLLSNNLIHQLLMSALNYEFF